jgi:peptidyl-prolyl cis-trans isomerase A (cyclophilin A)
MARLTQPSNRKASAQAAAAIWTLGALAVGLVVGCRAPRDPDLEQRVAAARADKPSESPAASATPEPPPPGAAERAATTPAVPKAADEVLRTLSSDELKAIMAAVGGEGPALTATFRTPRGDIRCVLDAEAAPQAVGNFIALATSQRPWRDPDTGELMKTPFYTGLTFHRVITGYIIQTGNPGVGGGGPGWRIPRETGIVGAFDQEGAMAMVDAGDDTHGSQFFITLRASKSLAERYVPFGRCGNLDVARTIADAEKLPVEGSKTPTKPVAPVRIESVEIARQPAQ